MHYIICNTIFQLMGRVTRRHYFVMSEILQSGHRWMECCIRCGPGEKLILDIAPRGTELGTQVKTGSRAGRTNTLPIIPSSVYWNFIMRN